MKDIDIPRLLVLAARVDDDPLLIHLEDATEVHAAVKAVPELVTALRAAEIECAEWKKIVKAWIRLAYEMPYDAEIPDSAVTWPAQKGPLPAEVLQHAQDLAARRAQEKKGDEP